ncbi:hypothetical protein [Variovorax paradoxus]|uniref:hypothetical protein n=1 Tax=Variovorax paradoxus TaxID=34073 RepID=UPI003ECF7BDB
MIVIVRHARPKRRTTTPQTGPIGGLADERFKYAPSYATDIRKTFRRIAAEQRRGERA